MPSPALLNGVPAKVFKSRHAAGIDFLPKKMSTPPI